MVEVEMAVAAWVVVVMVVAAMVGSWLAQALGTMEALQVSQQVLEEVPRDSAHLGVGV